MQALRVHPCSAVISPHWRAVTSVRQAKNRERLVDLLLESLEVAPDLVVEQAWRQEIRRRVAAYERGKATLFDANAVMAEAERLAR